MVKIAEITGAEGTSYLDAPQGSPEWIAGRLGKVGASELHKWMAVAKRPDKDGFHKPLQARIDLERQLAFEKAFGVPFTFYMNGAMQDGIDNEDFVRKEYEKATGNKVQVVGAFTDAYSVASPDGLVADDGGIEIKWLKDNSWSQVVATQKPYSGSSGDHYLQIQGNLRLSGRKWWDYVAGNESTGRFIILRIERDEELISKISESVKDVENVEPMGTDNVFEFSTAAPATNSNNIWED